MYALITCFQIFLEVQPFTYLELSSNSQYTLLWKLLDLRAGSGTTESIAKNSIVFDWQLTVRPFAGSAQRMFCEAFLKYSQGCNSAKNAVCSLDSPSTETIYKIVN